MLKKLKTRKVELYEEDIQFLKENALKDYEIGDLIHFVLDGTAEMEHEGKIWKTDEYRI